MPKLPPGFLKACLALLIAAACLPGRTAEPARDGNFIVYGDQNLPPYEFLEGGSAKGAVVDLLKEVSARTGRKTEIRLGKWDESQAAVLSGRGHALTLMTRTTEREQVYDFSDDTFPVTFSLFVAADRQHAISNSNLRGLRIGVTNGGFPKLFLEEHHPEAELVIIEDSADGIRRLLRREIDAVMGNTWPLEYFVSQLNISGVARVNPPLSVRSAAFAIPKDRAAGLLDEVNRALRAIRDDGTYDRIMDKWSVKKVYLLNQGTVSRMAALAAVAALLFLFVVTGLVVLRHQRNALAREVAQRRRSEAALLETQGLLKSVFDTDTCGIVILDAHGCFHEANARFCQMTGYSVEELRAMGTPMALSHPDDVSLEQDAFEAYLRGETDRFHVEKRYVRKDGTIVWVEVNSAPVLDIAGRPGYRVGLVQDITSRRQIEWALKDSARALRLEHDRFTAAVQASTITVFTQDRNLRYNFVENADLFFGKVAVLGRTDSELIESAEEGRRLTEIKRRVLDDGISVREEIGIVRAGAQKWFDLSVHPQFENGQVTGLLGTAVDTTQRHHAEDRLREALAAAASADNAKSRFLAAASHDLRQPLSALKIYTAALKPFVEPGSGSEMLGNMEDCTASLSELLGDLLDLSKLDAGVVKPQLADFRLSDVLSQLVSIHAPEAEIKGLCLRCIPSTDIVRTDPVLLRRMLGNILANAIRYTPKGGVLIGCRRKHGKLWVEVWDTGIGIPKGDMGVIFEEFRQLDGGARTRGSGLGLAIVAKTAALLDLEIRVTSRVGRGSMFAVEVPARIAADVPALPRPHPTSSVEQKPLQIAVVEDNAHFREALVHVLKSRGHTVRAAGTGRELLRLLADFRPDVLIADYRLPEGETGFSVIQSAEVLLGEPLPAILLTGDTTPQLVRSMAARGVPVLHKPVDFDALNAQLREMTATTTAS